MRFIERRSLRRVITRLRNGLTGIGLIAGCTTPPPEPPLPVAEAPAPKPKSGPSADVNGSPAAARQPTLPLPPPAPVRNWDEVRQQAARRLVAANPGMTYLGTVPDQLLAIPVLEIDLHADGSIRRIQALRLPRQAGDTTQLAIDALRRAAPFGDVSRLPKPWRFVETFLFNDERKFKPRTLD